VAAIARSVSGSKNARSARPQGTALRLDRTRGGASARLRGALVRSPLMASVPGESFAFAEAADYARTRHANATASQTLASHQMDGSTANGR
jgi:hypothetical protein